MVLPLRNGHLRICEYEEEYRNCMCTVDSRVEIGEERDACMLFLPKVYKD